MTLFAGALLRTIEFVMATKMPACRAPGIARTAAAGGLRAAKQTVRAWASGGALAAGDRPSRGSEARGRSRATAARAA